MELRLTGNPSRSPQTDVYSLGVLLFHLLTGTYPVGGGNLQEVREAHTLGKRIALGVARPDLPNTIVGVIERAIDPDPTNRYDGPEALGSELTTLLASSVDDRSAATRVDATDVESTGTANQRFWASNGRWWLGAGCGRASRKRLVVAHRAKRRRIAAEQLTQP